jgi:hypothetical protein
VAHGALALAEHRRPSREELDLGRPRQLLTRLVRKLVERCVPAQELVDVVHGRVLGSVSD